LNYRYQHKLTSYLSKQYKASRFNTIYRLEMHLVNILIYSNFATDLNVSKNFIDSGYIYLNGFLLSSYKTLLFSPDFLQLVISLKYYITCRWLTNWHKKQYFRIKKYSFLQNSRQTWRLDKQKGYKIPNWVYQNKFYKYDIPKYLEVDFLTLSIFFLYDPFLPLEFNSVNLQENKGPIYNMYN